MYPLRKMDNKYLEIKEIAKIFYEENGNFATLADIQYNLEESMSYDQIIEVILKNFFKNEKVGALITIGKIKNAVMEINDGNLHKPVKFVTIAKNLNVDLDELIDFVRRNLGNGNFTLAAMNGYSEREGLNHNKAIYYGLKFV